MSDQINTFITLWHALKSETKDKARLLRLESRVDSLWAKLSQPERDSLARKLFPEIEPAMRIFDAHAVRIRD
ncbi:MAG: hypothetical protein PHG69_05725 [Candidatus Omnitrophica bacterium]|jgi:hypothetical protein|nr:hypothetical protein [Candidatus Omnitrophota bacterium]